MKRQTYPKQNASKYPIFYKEALTILGFTFAVSYLPLQNDYGKKIHTAKCSTLFSRPQYSVQLNDCIPFIAFFFVSWSIFVGLEQHLFFIQIVQFLRFRLSRARRLRQAVERYCDFVFL